MSIPENINKKHLLQAIEKIDEEGIPIDANSQYYDVVYNGKKYPPKLIISLANIFANGEVLDRQSFAGGLDTQSFKILKDNGFVIEKKSEINKMRPNVWVEKTLVNGRADRIQGERALGKALWSPQKDKRGADIYKNMRAVQHGDIVIHLIDNQKFSGVSLVKKSAIETAGIAGTDWDGTAYLIELYNYTTLKPTIDRTDLLIDKNKSALQNIANKSEVFYNNKLDLRQGAYLTPCPTELLRLINETYNRLSNTNLPFIENIDFEISDIETFNTFDLKNLINHLTSSGLQLNERIITRFAGSLLTKPFVILTGLSGSGKTKLAQAFAMWICENANQYCLEPVGADWTNREPLLGFPNALKEKEYIKPDNGILDLIIDAIENSDKPYFLILDEMNLSHVERYFADFLSAMELSNGFLRLHDDTGQDWDDVPAKLEIPNNLFVIGTVNVDETTYMFSPKVLDRANVIEFRVSDMEMKSFLENPVKPDLGAIAGKGAQYAKAFVAAAKQKDVALEETLRVQVSADLMTFFPSLKEVGTEFGYRTAHEISRFVYFYKELSGADFEFNLAMDASIMQKLLPKLHGSKKKLGPVLGKLKELCDVRFPVSTEKIVRMQNRLAEHGFTSFAEA